MIWRWRRPKLHLYYLIFTGLGSVTLQLIFHVIKVIAGREFTLQDVVMVLATGFFGICQVVAGSFDKVIITYVLYRRQADSNPKAES